MATYKNIPYTNFCDMIKHRMMKLLLNGMLVKLVSGLLYRL